MIQFFNTLSGGIETFVPMVEGRVSLYTCGPTVYDYAHIGNFRAYLFEDLLKRYLIYMGYTVKHVMNITDIDDKTIQGAQKRGISLDEYTQTYIDAFFRDLDRLNINKADVYPRATEHIPDMVHMVKGLLDKGYAYEREGSVYFSIAKFPEYGRLSKISLDKLQPGKRVESDEYAKESAVDFVLWKGKKEGEPFWETELGDGRPGWHIECSVMSSRYLGESFDIHCGGVDNIFPHHENEIAQSQAYSGKTFVKYWLHCHHLIVDGEKMSKSEGNFYTLPDLLDKGYDARAIRFLLISTHYRKQLNFTFEALRQAQSSLQRLDDLLYELNNGSFTGGSNPEVKELIESARSRFALGLGDDLNISTAVSAVFEMVKRANILLSRKKIHADDASALIACLQMFDTVLAVLPREEGDVDAGILEKIRLREEARRDRNFALADRIREELLSEGIVLEDTKEGVRWKRR
jgi:cysteinyl-tRNA synthetase